MNVRGYEKIPSPQPLSPQSAASGNMSTIAHMSNLVVGTNNESKVRSVLSLIGIGVTVLALQISLPLISIWCGSLMSPAFLPGRLRDDSQWEFWGRRLRFDQFFTPRLWTEFPQPQYSSATVFHDEIVALETVSINRAGRQKFESSRCTRFIASPIRSLSKCKIFGRFPCWPSLRRRMRNPLFSKPSQTVRSPTEANAHQQTRQTAACLQRISPSAGEIFLTRI